MAPALLFLCLNSYITEAAAKKTGMPRPSNSVFGKWQLICPETQKNGLKKKCRISQSVVTKRGKKRIFLLRVYRSKTPIALVTTPLGIFLKPGIVLKIDDGKAEAFAFEACNQDGCHTGIALSARKVKRLKTGKVALFSFFDGAQNKISLTISLKGFGKAYDEMMK